VLSNVTIDVPKMVTLLYRESLRVQNSSYCSYSAKLKASYCSYSAKLGSIQIEFL